LGESRSVIDCPNRAGSARRPAERGAAYDIADIPPAQPEASRYHAARRS